MTEYSKQRWQAGEMLSSRLLLGAAVLILFALLMPTLRHGMLMGGDDPIHLAYTIELDRMIEEHGSIFGWTSMYGFGAPLFVFRPPGFYLVVQLLHLVSFGQLPLLLAHKLTYMLGILLMPLAIFYLLRKFSFRPLVCGAGALLALAPISTWGHSIEAYYDLGLAKQVIAIPLFVFTLGKLHGVLSSGERMMPAACLFGAMFVCHPYMARSFALVAGLYLLVELLSAFAWKRFLRAAACTAAIVLLGAGLAAFWLVPFFMSSEIHPASSMSMRLVPLFDVLSETATTTVSHFFRGSLYDRSLGAGDVFGGGSVTTNWAWRDNSQHHRLPLLTLFCIIGSLLCAYRYRAKACIFMLTGWLASLIIFLGPDDVPLLLLIPFQQEFQYVHFVAILDVFTICLAAVGLGGVVSYAVSLALGVSRVRSLDPSRRCVVVAIVAALIIVPTVTNIYAERFAGSRTKLSNKSFELKDRKQSAWSLRNPQNVPVHDLMNTLAEQLGRFERFYAHIPDIWHSSDVYHFSLAPAYIQRGNATAPVIANIMGGVNSIFGYRRLEENLWEADALLDLLRIRALVTQAGGLDGNAGRAVDYTGGPWRVYLRDSGGQAVGWTERPLILVVADQLEWESLCMSWVQTLKSVPVHEFEGYPFLLRFEKDHDWNPLESTAALYIADPSFDPIDTFGKDAWDVFRSRKLPVFARSRDGNMPDWASVAVLNARQMAWNRFIVEPGSRAQITVLDESENRLSLDLSTKQAGILYLKAAYYRGWEVEVDGRSAQLLCVSPGYSACRVGPGEHQVSFRYHGPNGGRVGAGVSLATLIMLGLLTFVKRRHDDVIDDEVDT